MTLKTFNDIYIHTNNMTCQQKGKLFEQFTISLFKHDPKLKANLKHIWLYQDVPKTIKLELNLPSVDHGIDALAVMDNKYYAIQSKFRQDPNTVISWRDLSTFFALTFGITDKIAGGYIITNTSNINKVVASSQRITIISGNKLENVPKIVLDETWTGIADILEIPNENKIEGWQDRIIAWIYSWFR